MFVRGVIVYYYNFDATGVKFNTIRPSTKKFKQNKTENCKNGNKKARKRKLINESHHLFTD